MSNSECFSDRVRTPSVTPMPSGGSFTHTSNARQEKTSIVAPKANGAKNIIGSPL